MSAGRPLQLTFAILKPDLIQRPFAAKTVRSMMLREEFWIVRSTLLHWEMKDAQQFYAEHEGKFFYNRLVSYMSSGPINPMVLAHPNAVEAWRRMMGPTKSYVARATDPKSIRGRFGLSDTRNSTHGADSPESALREMKLLFPDFDPDNWLHNEEVNFRSGNVLYNKLTNQHEPLNTATRKSQGTTTLNHSLTCSCPGVHLSSSPAEHLLLHFPGANPACTKNSIFCARMLA